MTHAVCEKGPKHTDEGFTRSINWNMALASGCERTDELLEAMFETDQISSVHVVYES